MHIKSIAAVPKEPPKGEKIKASENSLPNVSIEFNNLFFMTSSDTVFLQVIRTNSGRINTKLVIFFIVEPSFPIEECNIHYLGLRCVILTHSS
ncbi:hypothetical protein [Borreliella burgdorferi]|uniref:hypothetical protein n=1 Tax=Borreliella burgdorferi TaxID=139 RepID=UPI000D03210C|nr:hypothetical protein [Borreliella burgdorferi]PRR35972.1 hypothetical protein CV680_04735 [Borreliella burgdorferi]